MDEQPENETLADGASSTDNADDSSGTVADHAVTDSVAAGAESPGDGKPTKIAKSVKRNAAGHFQPGTAGGPGPPLGTQNGLKHGLTAWYGTSVMPSNSGAVVQHALRAFRKALEEAVIGARGEIQFTDSIAIHSVTQHEGARLLLRRWLRREEKALTPSEKLSYLMSLTKLTEARDKAVAALKLSPADKKSVIDQLFPALPAVDFDVTPKRSPTSSPATTAARIESASTGAAQETEPASTALTAVEDEHVSTATTAATERASTAPAESSVGSPSELPASEPIAAAPAGEANA